MKLLNRIFLPKRAKIAKDRHDKATKRAFEEITANTAKSIDEALKEFKKDLAKI